MEISSAGGFRFDPVTSDFTHVQKYSSHPPKEDAGCVFKLRFFHIWQSELLENIQKP